MLQTLCCSGSTKVALRLIDDSHPQTLMAHDLFILKMNKELALLNQSTTSVLDKREKKRTPGILKRSITEPFPIH